VHSIPEEPVARPPQAFCEARDIAMVASSLRAAHKEALAAAKRSDKKGAPATCHAARATASCRPRSTA
jgi:hypothetical protein